MKAPNYLIIPEIVLSIGGFNSNTIFKQFLPGLMLLTMPRKAFPSRQLRPKSFTSMPKRLVTCWRHHWRRAFLAPSFHFSWRPPAPLKAPPGVLLRSSSDSPEVPIRPIAGEPKRWPSLARTRVFSSICQIMLITILSLNRCYFNMYWNDAKHQTNKITNNYLYCVEVGRYGIYVLQYIVCIRSKPIPRINGLRWHEILF